MKSIEPEAEILDPYTDWYGFDTENDETGKVTLTALVHESGNRWIWKEAGHLVKWCERQKHRPVVICHNLEYDLINEFAGAYPYLQLNYLKGRLISARAGAVKFIDSGNHFRMTLQKLGESIGIKKLEMDINDEEYVSTDAWICLKGMTMARDYIASIGGKIGATSGSSAVSIWRKMTDDEFCTGAVDSPWLRAGYYGGRTEIFQKYVEGNIRGYDVNSMYPYCMLWEYPEYLLNDPGMDKSKGMAEVTVAIPIELFVAPLPWRTPDDCLWYPTGVIRGVWTYDEIRFAVKHDARVLEVHKAYGCNSIVRPFDEYIHTLYDKRKKSSSESERLFLKVLMNSLYGKLATKSVVTRTVSKYNLLRKKSKRMDEVKWIDHNRGLLDYQTPAPPYVNVCWGAMVTANSRMTLTKYFYKVPPNSLIYGDTDSIYVVNHTLPEGKELGELKLEKVAKKMHVVQPKAYMLDGEYKAKGVPKPKMGEDGSIEIDFARQYIEEGRTVFKAPVRFRASLTRKGVVANEWVEMSRSRRTEYRAKRYGNGRYYPPIIGQQLKLNLGLDKQPVDKKKVK